MSSKNVHAPILGICEYTAFYHKRRSADIINIKDLKMGRLLRILVDSIQSHESLKVEKPYPFEVREVWHDETMAERDDGMLRHSCGFWNVKLCAEIPERPLEDGKGKEMDCSPNPPERNSPAKPWF